MRSTGSDRGHQRTFAVPAPSAAASLIARGECAGAYEASSRAVAESQLGSLSRVADCIFCAIAAGEAPATIVAEDADTIAFMDINPWRPGHALVVPRRHYENLLEIEPGDLTKTFAAAQRLAARMKERLGAENVVLWNSCRPAAGQVVMHFHLHMIPANPDDPPLPPRPDVPADEAEIANAAAALRDGG